MAHSSSKPIVCPPFRDFNHLAVESPTPWTRLRCGFSLNAVAPAHHLG